MKPRRALNLGSCLLNAPLLSARSPHIRTCFRDLGAGHSLLAPTLGAALQLLRIFRGELAIPEDIAALCYDPLSFGRRPVTMRLDEIDVVLVEIATPVELTFRGFVLERNRLAKNFVKPLAGRYPELGATLERWRALGLQKAHEPVRAQCAAALLAALPAQEEARAVIEQTRSFRRDADSLTQALAQLRGLLGRPLGLVLNHYRYRHDNLPECVPEGFVDDVREAARRLGVPVHDPAATVARHGVANAMMPDRRHYAPHFLPVVGADYLAFIERLSGPFPAPVPQEVSAARATIAMLARAGRGGEAALLFDAATAQFGAASVADSAPAVLRALLGESARALRAGDPAGELGLLTQALRFGDEAVAQRYVRRLAAYLRQLRGSPIGDEAAQRLAAAVAPACAPASLRVAAGRLLLDAGAHEAAAACLALAAADPQYGPAALKLARRAARTAPGDAYRAVAACAVTPPAAPA